MLTVFPEDYTDPQKYTISGNCAKYPDRGWCFCESSWARMVKDADLVGLTAARHNWLLEVSGLSILIQEHKSFWELRTVPQSGLVLL